MERNGSDGESVLAREFAASPREVIAAVLHVHPRHMKLTSANVASIRFTFDSAADGFHVGENLTATLTETEAGTHVALQCGRPELREASELAMASFLDLVARQIDRDAADGVREQR